VPERRGQSLPYGVVPAVEDTERLTKGRQDEVSVADGDERDEANAVGELVGDLGCHLECQARLADTTRSGQGDDGDVHVEQQGADGRDLPGASDQRIAG
jgi:hypothetical protein